MKWLFRLIFIFFSVSFFAQGDYTLLSIPPELLKNTNSVVIEEVVDVDATNIRKMKVTTRRVVAVLNKKGVGDARAYEFYNEDSRVRKISAEVYDAFGNRKNRYKKKDFLDVSRTGNNMYTDSRVVYLDYTPTFYPYILVFESEVESGDSAFLNAYEFFVRGYAESLLNSEINIRFSSDNKIRYKGKNLAGYDITISETPNELSIKAKNIRALRYEEYSPSFAEILPHVLLAFNNFQLKNVMASVDSWENFGTWMEGALLSDVNDIPETTISRIKQLVSNEETNEAKARKIYEFVQDKVRYVSIQIGIGGWKPMPASDVDRLSYGDCKALTNYTKALLDAVGIPSYYTIVYGDRSHRDLDDDFASIQGNHVILGIPDGDDITWLECTSQDVPYGYIGSFTEDRNVVMITPEGGRLGRTKTYESLENTQEIEATVQVTSAGALHANFKRISKGLQYENRYGLVVLNESDVDRYYKNRWGYINGFSILDYEFVNNRDSIVFTEKLSFELPNYGVSVGDNYLLAPNVFNQFTEIPPQIRNRTQNLRIRHGFLDDDVVTIDIPSDMIIESLPEAIHIENKFGTYEVTYSQLSEQRLEYRRKFLLNRGEFSPDAYQEYREFLRTVSRSDQTKILLTKK